MKLNRCPVCHSHITLEALCQDEAGRELLALLAGLDAYCSRPLVQYLGLFRAPGRDLSNERALRLARGALALCADYLRLGAALGEATDALRAKGLSAPMKNHNYLARVLESLPLEVGAAVVLPAMGAQPQGMAGGKRKAADVAAERLLQFAQG